MYEVLDKDTIKSEILPYLSAEKRGYVTKSDLVEVIQCILYKLKTGCQWHMLTPTVLRLMGIISAVLYFSVIKSTKVRRNLYPLLHV